MERLTKLGKNGIYGLAKVKDNEQEVDSPYPNTLKAILEAFQRLAEYENTGLSPSEIPIRSTSNLPLSKEQVDAMDKLAAVWYVSNDYSTVDLVLALDARANWACFHNDLLFAAPPTFDDISEARRKPMEES